LRQPVELQFEIGHHAGRRLAARGKGLTLRQIDAILELQLYRLTQLSIDELLIELKQVRERIAEYESILASEAKLRAVIVKELEEVRDKYGDARRTQILDESAELQLEDLIADEQVAVTVSHQGYLKRTPISIYRSQRRGGSGAHGHEDARGRFCLGNSSSTPPTPICLLYQLWPCLLGQGVRGSRCGRGRQGQIHAEPARSAAGRKFRAILPVRDLEEEGKFISSPRKRER